MIGLFLSFVLSIGAADPLGDLAVAATSPGDLVSAETLIAELVERGLASPDTPITPLPDRVDAVTDWLAGTDSDTVILLGVSATRAVTSGAPASTRIIAGLLHDPSLFGIAFDTTGRSGIAGVNLVLPPNRTKRDLELLGEIVPTDHLAILLDEALIAAHRPVLTASLHELATELGIQITPIPVTADIASVVARIDDSIDAVYAGPLSHLDETARRALWSELARRGLPSFAMRGLEDVVAGAFLGALDRPERRLVDRMADHVAAVVAGERPEDLPAYLPLTERMVLGGRVAQIIGFTPDLETRIRAEILFPEALTRGEPMTLHDAIETALANNPDLEARREAVAIAELTRKTAVAGLLPQITLSTRHSRNDDDNPQIANGLAAENQTSASLTGRQVLFDESLRAGIKTAALSAERTATSLARLERDTVAETAEAYALLLVRGALLDIEIENLRLTRANLETARSRIALGAAGREELYNWESREAQQLGAVYAARSERESARATLTRLLGTSPDREYSLTNSRLGAESSIFLAERWERLMTESGTHLETVLTAMTDRRSEEVREAELLGEIADRGRREARRAFYLPDLTLDASLNDVIDQEFVEGGVSFPGLDFDRDVQSWNLTLTASIPVFTGGRRAHALGRARADQRQAIALRSSAEGHARERTRRALAALAASWPNLSLTRRSADRAGLSLAIVGQRYAEGSASFLDLLEAQEQALAARQRAAVAEHTHLANCFRMQRALSLDWRMTAAAREAWLTEVEERVSGLAREGERKP